MRSVLAVGLLLVALAGCSSDTDQPTTSTPPATRGATKTPTPTASVPPEIDRLEAPTRAAVKCVEALRAQDASALYDLASSGLQRAVTREDFIVDMGLGALTEARISNVLELGFDSNGVRTASAPLEVTAGGMTQSGFLVLVREKGEWKFVNLASEEDAPVLTRERPAKP